LQPLARGTGLPTLPAVAPPAPRPAHPAHTHPACCCRLPRPRCLRSSAAGNSPGSWPTAAPGSASPASM